VTGHSYIVYGPLANGATSFMYEGAPTHPYPNRWWRMVENYGITILYTAPTAIRGLMRYGDNWANRHDLSSLRLLGSVGEPINPEAWRWYFNVIGKRQCPIMDTWWQTETGGFMITPLPITPLKPGSATRPFFGIDVDVVNEQGKPAGGWRGGLPGGQKALARHAAHHLSRPGSLQKPVLRKVWGHVPDRRLGPQGQGWLRLDHRAHR
jgi:acetyl-CoA synthetase